MRCPAIAVGCLTHGRAVADRAMATAKTAMMVLSRSAVTRDVVARFRWGFVALVGLTCPSHAIGQSGGLQSDEVRQEAASTPVNEKSPIGWGGILGGVVPADLLQSAIELRAASESAERWVVPLSQSIEAIVASIAEMSSGFDPLGLQASAEVMLRQTEIIAEQQGTIERLQQEEIERLREENQRLQRRLDRSRSRLDRSRNRAATNKASGTGSSADRRP